MSNVKVVNFNLPATRQRSKPLAISCETTVMVVVRSSMTFHMGTVVGPARFILFDEVSSEQ